MKAAVLHRFGRAPRYEDFSAPVPESDEILLRVQAVALENVDKALARGSHYATRQLVPHLPAITGIDGSGTLENGRMVGFGGVRPSCGAMAELAPIRNLHYIPIPEGVDAATAAAVPSSTLTALLALKWGAKLQRRRMEGPAGRSASRRVAAQHGVMPRVCRSLSAHSTSPF